jgi:hypothetical protein
MWTRLKKPSSTIGKFGTVLSRVLPPAVRYSLEDIQRVTYTFTGRADVVRLLSVYASCCTLC